MQTEVAVAYGLHQYKGKQFDLNYKHLVDQDLVEEDVASLTWELWWIWFLCDEANIFTQRRLYSRSSQYTICAGGSNRCSCCGCCHGRTGCGFCGCVTYVQGNGLNNFCANGGAWGVDRSVVVGATTVLTMHSVTSATSEVQSCSCGYDFAIGGVRSTYHANLWCHTEFRQMASGASGHLGCSSIIRKRLLF